MPTILRLRRFSNPATLKSIEPGLFRQFLEPYRDLLARRGIRFDQPTLDYDALGAVLLSADESMPDAMLDSLFFVDEMSVPGCFDDLMDAAQTLGLDLDGSEPSAADLAVRIWLADPATLERLHAERFLVRPKSFQSFLSTSEFLPLETPAPEQITALEKTLNDWFEVKKRGRGTRVFVFLRDYRAWFLIRHGEPYKREGTIEGNESSSVYFRPEKFDVVTYNGDTGELAIHADSKGEKRIYCRAIGKHLFDDIGFFDAESTDGRYTLSPIIESGRACLDVEELGDVIRSIELVELHFRHDSSQFHVEVHRADDVFAALEDLQRTVPESAQLIKATFRITFRNAVRPRKVVVRPPSVTIFDRESDAEMLERWMELRGFIRNSDVGAERFLQLR